MKRFLQVFRDGEKLERSLITPLAEGEAGNFYTLGWMKTIVDEDRAMPDLRRFVSREIVGGVKGHDVNGEISRIFEFARDRIVYRKDPWGIERVADLWSTLYALNPDHPEGDCGIKSTFIATCCALLGYKPAFVIVKQRPNQQNFDHVYAAVLLKGQWVHLDATPEESVIDWQVRGYEKFYVPVFE